MREAATPEIAALQFFAIADIELNQKTLKFQPSGWSDALTGAISECLKNFRRFDYEGPVMASASSSD